MKPWIFLVILILLTSGPSLGSCLANDLHLADTQFKTFGKSWVQKIQSAYLYSREHPKIEPDGTIYVASYYYIDPASVRTDVQQAPGSDQIYTGVLHYNEYLFQSRGNTREQALAGQYAPFSMKQMMEIFLYQDGSWVR